MPTKPNKWKYVVVQRELLENARTLAPLSTYAAVTNDALRMWIAAHSQKPPTDDA